VELNVLIKVLIKSNAMVHVMHVLMMTKIPYALKPALSVKIAFSATLITKYMTTAILVKLNVLI